MQHPFRASVFEKSTFEYSRPNGTLWFMVELVNDLVAECSGKDPDFDDGARNVAAYRDLSSIELSQALDATLLACCLFLPDA